MYQGFSSRGNAGVASGGTDSGLAPCQREPDPDIFKQDVPLAKAELISNTGEASIDNMFTKR